jgi:hypothetical protein
MIGFLAGVVVGVAALAAALAARRASSSPGAVDTYSIALGVRPGEIVVELCTDDRRRTSSTWDARLAHRFSDEILTAAARSLPQVSQ